MTFWDRITYYALLGLGRTLCALPLRVQYGIADLIGFFLYHVLKYRLDVVRTNLKHAFAQKSDQELRQIEKKYYKHLSDIVIESLTLIGISERAIKKRYFYKNREQFAKHHPDRGVVAAMAHFGSWEYAINYALYSPVLVLPVYNPLLSKPFDKLYKKARSKFGAIPIAMNTVAREMLANRSKYPVLALIADQSPKMGDGGHWINFLNMETLFFNGMGKLSLKYGLAIEYLCVTKVKRGYYEIEFKQIYDGMEKIDEVEITKRYVSLLEQDILRNPHLWLWSHRRWKNTRTGVNIYEL